MTMDGDTPEELVRFFTGLSSDTDPAVAAKGLDAARRLLEVQRALGPVSAPGESEAISLPTLPVGGASHGGDDAGGAEEELQEARAELDSMLMQNMKLTKENQGLKERVAKLEERIERLYNMRELKTTLSQISSTGGGGGGKTEARPAAQRSLKDEFEVESAARVPPGEREPESGENPEDSSES